MKGASSPGKSTERDVDFDVTATISIFCAGSIDAAASRQRLIRVRLNRFIISTLRIVRVLGRGCGGSPRLQDGVDGRQDGQSRKSRNDQPANDGPTERR